MIPSGSPSLVSARPSRVTTRSLVNRDRLSNEIGGTRLSRPLRHVGSSFTLHRARQARPSISAWHRQLSLATRNCFNQYHVEGRACCVHELFVLKGMRVLSQMPVMADIAVLWPESARRVVSVTWLGRIARKPRPMLISYTLLDGRINAETTDRVTATTAGVYAHLGCDISLAEDHRKPRSGGASCPRYGGMFFRNS